MGISEESVPKSHDEIPVRSSFGKIFECYVRERYLMKISAVGLYRAAIPSERFSSECLPPVQKSRTCFAYLVLETSFYTNTQFKALKSLDTSG